MQKVIAQFFTFVVCLLALPIGAAITELPSANNTLDSTLSALNTPQANQSDTNDTLSLKPTSSPQTFSLKEVLAKAESNKTVLLAKEQIADQKAQLRRNWSAYIPKLEITGTYTFNVPKIVLNFDTARQNQQNAQLLKDVSSLMDANKNNLPNSQGAAQEASRLLQSANALENQSVPEILYLPRNVFDSTLQLNVPLLNMPAYSSIQTGNLQVKQQEKNFDYSRATALISVARAYFQAVRMKRLSSAAKNQLQRSKEQLQQVQEKYRKGLARLTDTQRQLVEVATNEQQVSSSEANKSYALGALGVLINVGEVFRINEDTTVLSIENQKNSEQFVEQGLSYRQDYHAQRAAVKVAEQTKEGVYWGFMPTLNFLGQGYYTTNASGFINQHFRAALILQASLKIYDGGDRYGQLDKAQSQIRKEKIKLADLEQRIEAEIRGKLTDLSSKREALASAKTIFELQKNIYQQDASDYQKGLLDVLDYIRSNHALYDKEVAYKNAQTDIDVARMELAYLTGNFFSAIGEGV